jgi:hypothetical protein
LGLNTAARHCFGQQLNYLASAIPDCQESGESPIFEDLSELRKFCFNYIILAACPRTLILIRSLAILFFF